MEQGRELAWKKCTLITLNVECAVCSVCMCEQSAYLVNLCGVSRAAL